MRLYDLFVTQKLLFCRYTGLKLFKFLLILTLIYFPELQADDHNVYSLPRIGGLVIGSNNIADVQIVGVVVGLRVDNALYLESELNTSVAGGEYFSAREKGQLNITNFNLYGVFRHVFNNRFYGKLKAGIAYNSLKYDIANSLDVNNDGGGLNGAIGLGIGVVFSAQTNPFMFELEYAMIDKDIEMFTIGLTNPF